ncbi:MAG TPA: tetratricopeptide repeat protein [Xanthobacteraceae bacterium]|nr:tetratricopeptide repeat protein [Xanthobacteraceae bacterium]
MRETPSGSSTADFRSSRDRQLDRAGAALNQQPREAERVASEILDAEPHHPRALQLLGKALVAQGRGGEAITAIEASVRNRRDPELETILAMALRQTGRLDDALFHLKRTVKRHARHAPAFRELGSLLFVLERFDEAIVAFKSGLDIAPMMPELSIELGRIFLHRRDCSNAKAAFARALSIVPNSAEALFGMAKAHQEIGENDAAAGYFRSYLMLRPNDTKAWINLGLCLLELGQRDAGHDCFRTVVRSHPEYYAETLGALASSGRGRFWLRPSAAASFLGDPKA